MPPPPPPADAPAPIGTTDFLSGFQTDYSRVGTDGLRRPVVSEEQQDIGVCTGAQGKAYAQNDERPVTRSEPTALESGNNVTRTMSKEQRAEDEDDSLPKPGEAYILLRHHRLPRVGWNDGIARDLPEIRDWSYELRLLQKPSRGKALGLQPLPRGWPALSPPLIVQLIVRDKHGRSVSVDNPALNRRLVHTSMMVDLVSPDGSENRSVMRIRQHDRTSLTATNEPEDTPSLGNPTEEDSQRNLLGSLHRSATSLALGNERGIFFIFTELVVRNTGDYALSVKLLDLAGPSHLGTSIGVTGALATALTQPLTVYHGTTFPGSVPTTDVSILFTRQGERDPGTANQGNSATVPFEDDLVSPSEEPNY
ncbi:hypothetical protein I317_05559 [Kwoniella heveanensis CBS 569]|nr:hypothetical protein I317_05559 [Kwoniella heveanensis CBS 569]